MKRDLKRQLDILDDIREERKLQDAKWGQQNHPNGTGGESDRLTAEAFKRLNAADVLHETVNWRAVLLEEVFEAVSETDYWLLRTELVQTAAVVLAWLEAIDRDRHGDECAD